MGAIDEFRDRIRTAVRDGATLRIRGGGTKDFYGAPLAGDVLDTTPHAGIVAYEPTELFVTARCGTRLADLEQALDEHHQMLAFEPPHYGAGATVGGMVAAGLCGPRRVQAGPLRDYVLGVRIIDGRGDELAFGGRVMKNVAGYDVSRLMAGSLGTLAVISEVTLKVMPRPVAEMSLRYELPQDRTLARLADWGARPLPISASAWHQGALTVRLSGGVAAVNAARERLGGEPVPDVEAREFWQSLRDQTHPFFGPALWRASLPAGTTLPDLPGETLLEWGGALCWLPGDAPDAGIRAAANRAGGHATLFRGSDELKRVAGVFDPVAPTLARLQRRVKQAFDPAGAFDSTRMHSANGVDGDG